LFPGGIGGIYDIEQGEVPIKEWGQHLLQYYDSRFLDDSLFDLPLYNLVSSNIQITERVISSSTLTDSLGKTHQLWNN
jgi:hypothetical protein